MRCTQWKCSVSASPGDCCATVCGWSQVRVWRRDSGAGGYSAGRLCRRQTCQLGDCCVSAAAANLDREEGSPLRMLMTLPCAHATGATCCTHTVPTRLACPFTEHVSTFPRLSPPPHSPSTVAVVASSNRVTQSCKSVCLSTGVN